MLPFIRIFVVIPIILIQDLGVNGVETQTITEQRKVPHTVVKVVGEITQVLAQAGKHDDFPTNMMIFFLTKYIFFSS